MTNYFLFENILKIFHDYLGVCYFVRMRRHLRLGSMDHRPVKCITLKPLQNAIQFRVFGIRRTHTPSDSGTIFIYEGRHCGNI